MESRPGELRSTDNLPINSSGSTHDVASRRCSGTLMSMWLVCPTEDEGVNCPSASCQGGETSCAHSCDRPGQVAENDLIMPRASTRLPEVNLGADALAAGIQPAIPIEVFPCCTSSFSLMDGSRWSAKQRLAGLCATKCKSSRECWFPRPRYEQRPISMVIQTTRVVTGSSCRTECSRHEAQGA